MLFLDESGDHSLHHIDQSYPVFVLGGVIMERTYYRNDVVPRMDRLKERFFGNAEVILHTTDIIRGRNGFEALNDFETRAAFLHELNQLMIDLDYLVVACAIRKDIHVARYGANGVDPYLYSLEVILGRFCHDIGDVEDGGIVFAEKRRSDLDEELDAQWKRLRERGTSLVGHDVVDGRIVDLSIKSKKLNIAGLQLADLVVSPIGRHVIGKAPREDWSIVEKKLMGRGRSVADYGLTILPE